MSPDPIPGEITSRPRTPARLRVAAVQATPAYLDADATLAIVARRVREAGAAGTDLVVFPESFVPGYPDWVWRRPPMRDAAWYERFAAGAVDVDGPDLDPVRAAAAEAGTWVALGITERSPTGTLYNSVVYVDRDGAVAGLHRKLVPTGAERLVWGNGQGPVLTIVDIDGVKVASLICWENYMPLARAALYERGVDVLLSPTWDNSDEWVPTLRHIAKEGGVYVVGVTAHLRGSDVPRDLPDADEIYGGDDDLMSAGNTCVVAPGGRVLQGPVTGREEMIVADLDLGRIVGQRRMFDPAGHYSRPDVLPFDPPPVGGGRPVAVGSGGAGSGSADPAAGR